MDDKLEKSYPKEWNFCLEDPRNNNKKNNQTKNTEQQPDKLNPDVI